jgi:hypothetical protein
MMQFPSIVLHSVSGVVGILFDYSRTASSGGWTCIFGEIDMNNDTFMAAMRDMGLCC